MLLTYVFTFLASCGAGYMLLVLFATVRWMRRRKSVAKATPGISILKPLRGTDREMYAAFRSHCLQEYPDFEIIFGVSDPKDAAIAEVERLRREFPSRHIEMVVAPESLGASGKVSTLLQMLPSATKEIILINDSDIRVETDYLRKVAAEFADAKTGMATSLYRAQAGETLASRVEAISVATDFAGGVLSALVVEGGLNFAMGSTLAIRREVLDEIGGLEMLADHLADDYELGARTARAGSRVALADTVVETHLASYGWGGMLKHQLRWARTIRDMRKGGYFGLIFTFALPWACLAAIFSGGTTWTFALLMDVLVLRMATAGILCGPVLRDRRSMQDLWLVPLRDFVGLAVWLWSYTSDTVEWRGEKFHLRDGKLFKR